MTKTLKLALPFDGFIGDSYANLSVDRVTLGLDDNGEVIDSEVSNERREAAIKAIVDTYIEGANQTFDDMFGVNPNMTISSFHRPNSCSYTTRLIVNIPVDAFALVLNEAKNINKTVKGSEKISEIFKLEKVKIDLDNLESIDDLDEYDAKAILLASMLDTHGHDFESNVYDTLAFDSFFGNNFF